MAINQRLFITNGTLFPKRLENIKFIADPKDQAVPITKDDAKALFFEALCWASTTFDDIERNENTSMSM